MRLSFVSTSARALPNAIELHPTISNSVDVAGVERTASSRIMTNTPAATKAAECRYADTGVGATIARGSQKWRGTCALFARTPTAMRSAAGSWVFPAALHASSPSRRVVPALFASRSVPARRRSEVPPVTASATSAWRRAISVSS